MSGSFSLSLSRENGGQHGERKKARRSVVKKKKSSGFPVPAAVIHQVSNKSWGFSLFRSSAFSHTSVPRPVPSLSFVLSLFLFFFSSHAYSNLLLSEPQPPEKYNLSRGSQSDLISRTLFFWVGIFPSVCMYRTPLSPVQVSLTCIYYVYANACYNNSDSRLMECVDPFLLGGFFFSTAFFLQTVAP